MDDVQLQQLASFLVTSGQMCCGLAVEMIRLDSLLVDIPLEVEEEAGCRKELVGVSLESYDNDDHCQQQTRFTKNQIRTTANALPPGNYVYVHCHPPKHYKFNLIELLIYALRRMSTGRTHKDLADNEFGGCPKRWGQGYNCLVCLVDRHFAPLIGPRGLAIWAPLFPDCAEAIREYITRPREKKDRNDNTIEIWMHDCPLPPGAFNVAPFTDAAACECCRPGSGPANPNPGAPRNADWCIRQRAFYDGCHRGMEACLKTLTLMLPNGVTAATYGPTSGRDDDRTMFRLGEFDSFLRDLCAQHHGGNRLYCACGDQIFAGYWSCLRTAHFAPPGYTLSDEEESMNENMKSAGESIEWSCARAESMFPLLTTEYHSKLEVDSGRVFAEVRVMHPLNNFNICCHEGSTMTGERMFRMAPPTLDEHLAMNTNDFTV